LVFSIQFSKSLVPCRAYHPRAEEVACQPPEPPNVGSLFVPPVSSTGAQRYGRTSRLSTPFLGFFRISRPSRAVLGGRAAARFDTSGTYQNAADCIQKERRGGRVPRQGLHVLGRTSRQDGGRLVESSNNSSPWETVLTYSTDPSPKPVMPFGHHREGAGSLSTLPNEFRSNLAEDQSLMLGDSQSNQE